MKSSTFNPDFFFTFRPSCCDGALVWKDGLYLRDKNILKLENVVATQTSELPNGSLLNRWALR